MARGNASGKIYLLNFSKTWFKKQVQIVVFQKEPIWLACRRVKIINISMIF